MVVALGIPLFPLGNLHIYEECVSCGEGTSHGLDDWEQEREETLVPALDAFASNLEDPNLCSQALQQVVALGELEEFLLLAGQIEAQFSQSHETLHQLAWCHGHFAQFQEARRLFGRVAQLDNRPERHQMRLAYEALPESSPPSAPSSFFQGLRVLIVPLILIVAVTASLSNSLKKRIESVYVVNGTTQAYDVLVNGERLTLPPQVLQRMTLKPGWVQVSPAEGNFEFAPFEFNLTERKGARPTTAVINPDKMALISWEELVYRNTETEEPQTNADQFALHAVAPYYLFYGITDHFKDPPQSLEVHSQQAETYRFVLHHLVDGPLASLCGLLMGQGENELAEAYCRLQLEADSDAVELLPCLLEVAPTQDSLAFLEARLTDRPFRFPWHLHYVTLAVELGMQADVEARYAALVKRSPMEGDLFYLLSLTRRDSEAAIADLETAAGQGAIEALLPLARRHTALGEFDAGLQQMDLALKAQPDNEDYLAQHDELLLATGQFPSLIETFRIRLQADPLNHHVATTLAGLYDANGQASHAQTVVDRYVQSVSLDGALVSEETAASRSYFASVRAEWKGDVDRYISIGERTNGRGAFNALVLKGDYVEAAATVDRAVTDPFLHFLLYGLTTKSGGLLALSEVQLSQALSLLEETPSLAQGIKPWFLAGAPPSSDKEMLGIDLLNHQRRVLLFALAQRHPNKAEGYLKLAKKLNYHRIFPYLVLRKALE